MKEKKNQVNQASFLSVELTLIKTKAGRKNGAERRKETLEIALRFPRRSPRRLPH